ncbi:glycoside hydrolase family 25 protein [Xanthomonas albilineans]|uniref:glycoside hydrolase family 25 protein n=1 Tax=Xanthomonas albilineans TaxID=29447 RepID=UPI0009B9CBDA|nr:glycoside hydrolase family 25 protein [Xanthomonas albilineans]
MYSKGIDISHKDGNIDFEKVADADVNYVFMKATEGGTYQDPNYGLYRGDALSAKLRLGTYHYFRGLSSTPEEQRDNIVSTLSKNDFDASCEHFAIDVELTGNENATPELMADNLYALLQLLENEAILGGKKPLIYCAARFWDEHVAGDKHDFSQYPLWVASWDVDQPRIPKVWSDAGKTWSIWQYTSKGNVPGISGDVDLDHVQL